MLSLVLSPVPLLSCLLSYTLPPLPLRTLLLPRLARPHQAMHGSVFLAREVHAAGNLDVHAVESSSGRTALHKAAFWGHIEMTDFLTKECKLNVNATDNAGDTALHDAARFGAFLGSGWLTRTPTPYPCPMRRLGLAPRGRVLQATCRC